MMGTFAKLRNPVLGQQAVDHKLRKGLTHSESNDVTNVIEASMPGVCRSQLLSRRDVQD